MRQSGIRLRRIRVIVIVELCLKFCQLALQIVDLALKHSILVDLGSLSRAAAEVAEVIPE